MAIEWRERLGHWRHLLRPAWVVLAALCTVFGALTAIRDNFLSPDTRARWDTLQVLKYLPNWPISVWIASGLGIVLAGVLEASYRRSRLLKQPALPQVPDESLLIRSLQQVDHEHSLSIQRLERRVEEIVSSGAKPTQQIETVREFAKVERKAWNATVSRVIALVEQGITPRVTVTRPDGTVEHDSEAPSRPSNEGPE